MSKLSKTARASVKAGRVEEKSARMSPERMITEVRNLRAGGLFVPNAELIDALLAAYDQALVDLAASRVKVEELGQALRDCQERELSLNLRRADEPPGSTTVL